MTASTKPRNPAKPRRRLFALAALLVLSLTLAAGLAWQAIQTARRHRVTAERALTDYAGFAAFILASRTYRQLGGAVVEAFANWNPSRNPLALPKGTACQTGSVRFERLPEQEQLRVIGPPFDSLETGCLRDTLRQAMPLLEEVGWRFRFIRARAPIARFDGIFITSFQAPSGGYGLRGFTACLGGTDSPFRQVLLTERALPPALTGDRPADSLFFVMVTSGKEAPVYRSPAAYESPYQGSARLGTEFGDLTVRLALRSDVADRLVIGGIPSSPTPLAIGLLGLSTLLVVTALLQLRREYELIAIRSEFMSNVSHELRTPLSQILIFTELLKLGRLRSHAERERSIEIIDQEARRLIRLVENVLQFSRSASRRRLEREPLTLAAVVPETLDAFRPLAASRGVTVRTNLASGLSVLGDRNALRQILLNLLDNAVKYGPKGQTVSVSAVGENGKTRIMVEDQGPGIPLEDRERVWDGYYRLQRERQSAVAGSGIGLAVVRSLTDEMEGRAWIEDTDTGGSRFVIELTSG